MVEVRAKKRKVLIVDDEESVLELLEDVLADEGFQVRRAENGSEALDMIARESFDVALMDIRMPEMDGMEALRRIQEQSRKTGVILMTAYATTDVAIQAMKMGAFDYVLKPFDLDEVVMVIKKAVGVQEMAGELDDLRLQLGQVYQPGTIIGSSPAMQEVYKTIGRVAASTATVLIRGESGTGKELVAQAIHFNSNRHQGPLVKLNCAALPESLLESELFGHERGAFTGAVGRKTGLFELAHGGTIFLDEIGEISPATQAKLLRVLQEKEIQRVGGTETLKIDVRIVAATNKNLERAVKEGAFREDLFFRLNVVPIFLPPLRERKEDIPLLAQYFLSKYSREFDKPVTGVSPEAIRLLNNYAWPGNIRELENVCERAVIMAQGPFILPEHIPMGIQTEQLGIDLEVTRSRLPLKEIVADIERQVILRVLEETNWNRTMAAESLGLNRRSLYAKMKEYGIEG